MENKNENETFVFTYSAKEQEEIQRIRKKYMEPEEDKIAQLRRLDAGVTKKANIISMGIGLIGALILGTGMSLIMTEFSKILGLFQDMAMMIGILIGAVGLIMICLAYPVYSRVLEKEKKRIAPEIIRLSDELMK